MTLRPPYKRSRPHCFVGFEGAHGSCLRIPADSASLAPHSRYRLGGFEPNLVKGTFARDPRPLPWVVRLTTAYGRSLTWFTRGTTTHTPLCKSARLSGRSTAECNAAPTKLQDHATLLVSPMWFIRRFISTVGDPWSIRGQCGGISRAQSGPIRGQQPSICKDCKGRRIAAFVAQLNFGLELRREDIFTAEALARALASESGKALPGPAGVPSLSRHAMAKESETKLSRPRAVAAAARQEGSSLFCISSRRLTARGGSKRALFCQAIIRQEL